MSSDRSRHGLAAIVLALVGALAGCGSTVPLTSTGLSGQQGVNGVPAVGTAGTGGSSGAGAGAGGVPTSVVPSVGTGSSGGTSSSTRGVPDTGASTTGSAGSVTARAGGTDTKPISIGVQYFDSATVNAFLNSAGSDKRIGDTRKQAQAVIDYLNARGGLAGHKIVPVYSMQSLTSSDTYAQEQQVTCTQWAQDNHVVAGVYFASVVSTAVIEECSRDHHFLLTHDGVYASQRSEFTSNPYFVVPSQLAAERWGPTVVEALASANFFGAQPKIGFMGFDDPASQAVKRSLSAALAKRGLKISDEYSMTAVQQTSDTGQLVTQIQSAVLKFQSDGVTHILSALAGGGSMPVFMQQAESQNYYPKYGLTSFDWFGQMPNGNANRKRTLTNSTAVGWAPITDVQTAQDPGNPTAQECRKIFGPLLLSRADEIISMTYCSFFLMLDAATKTLPKGAALDVNTLTRQVTALQGTWGTAMNLKTFLSPTQQDGVALVRLAAYNSDCDCFRYGATRPTA